MNNLKAFNCTWLTCPFLLGWVIYTVNTKLSLPPHQENRFKDILDVIPTRQKRIGADKWHQGLEELLPMDIDLTGAWGLFSHIKDPLRHVEGKQVTPTKGVHQAHAEFLWLTEDLGRHPTRLYELVPLHSTLDGYPDASGYMCGGSVLLGPTAVPWIPQPHPSAATTSLESAGSHPIVRRSYFTAKITARLVFCSNQEGQVTNSELELADRVIQHTFMEDCFDIHDQTTLSRMYNMVDLW